MLYSLAYSGHGMWSEVLKYWQNTNSVQSHCSAHLQAAFSPVAYLKLTLGDALRRACYAMWCLSSGTAQAEKFICLYTVKMIRIVLSEATDNRWPVFDLK
jgi:hypothetical protein